MAEKKEKAGDALEGRVEKLEKMVNDLAAKVRGMSDNWHDYVSKYVGSAASNGKIVGILVACLLVGSAFATELIVDNKPAPEGVDAVLRLSADDGDDTADILDIIMGADGTMHLDVGGTEVFDLDASGNLTLDGTITYSGDFTMANGETLDNATDAEVRITADDDAALLFELALESDNAVANIADNDMMSITATWYDSATNKQEYASIDFKSTDVTTATEDSQVILNYLAGGAAKALTVGANSSGVQTMVGTVALDVDSITVNAGAGVDCQAAGALQLGITTATSVDIGKTLLPTTIKGTFNVDEAATFDTSLGVTGVSTLTGGATVSEDIAVNFDANDEEILVTITNTSANPVRILGNDANPGSSTLLTLDLTADGDADAEYIMCRDNASADTKFKVDADGDTTVAGTLGVTGASTLTGGATISEDIAVNFDANDEEILVTITDTSANPVRILGNDANPGSSVLLTLDLTADGDADAEYIRCRDNASADTKFLVDADGATTVGSLNTGTGEATVDGKYAVVGGDATTGLMILAAEITSSATTLQTNSFATAFGAAPVLTISYTEDPGDVQPPYIVSKTTSNFVAWVTADKNFSYIAVGQRP